MNTLSIHHPLLKRYDTLYTLGERQALLQQMINEIQWQTNFVAFGRRFEMPRRQAWYADQGVHYRYSDNMLQSFSWNDTLLQLKNKVEEKTRQSFNSVLVTYYRDGHDHVTWHADDEVELGDSPVIASFSLGASRRFCYRQRHTGEEAEVNLHDGELLLMQAGFQEDYEHCVPEEPKIKEPRINLTFRNVVIKRESDQEK
ncbi:MAG: alpha-ketoglutarate-dependent dioxygenase AlkB [Gammaproteobacteria bacterium]